MWQEAVQPYGDGTKLLLEVTPGAKYPVFPAGFNEWRGRIGIKVRAQPQVGSANRAVIEAISEIGPCEVVAGHADSRKTVRVAVPPAEVIAWLSERM
jgi:uncharacterized protein (TIGR00251 family)